MTELNQKFNYKEAVIKQLKTVDEHFSYIKEKMDKGEAWFEIAGLRLEYSNLKNDS